MEDKTRKKREEYHAEILKFPGSERAQLRQGEQTRPDMAGSGCVLVERLEEVIGGVIGIVTLNRPSARNALTRNMLRDLTRALAELDKDDRVRCVVLRGEGRAFCAGIDLTAASGVFTGDADDKEYDAVGALERLRVPIVGAVHGACVTAGFEIALACDVLVASEDAFFHDTHCKWGIAPGTYSNTSLSPCPYDDDDDDDNADFLLFSHDDGRLGSVAEAAEDGGPQPRKAGLPGKSPPPLLCRFSRF